MTTLRVVTYNIQGHAAGRKQQHLDEVAAALNELQPDIVALQEVHRGTSRAASADQLQHLADATGLKLAFGPSLKRWGGEYGNAILTHGELSSIAVHALPGGGEPRSLLEARVTLRGFSFDFFVVHLAAWFWFLRRSRMRQLETMIEKLTDRTDPFILAGDFNVPPRSGEITKLRSAGQLRACGDSCAPTHRTLATQLDYIFSDHGWTTRRYETVAIGPSDHYPLVAELTRKEKESAK
jgi:endonuclease/exonuclease/phosphatase family metal-dependent hydrolase